MLSISPTTVAIFAFMVSITVASNSTVQKWPECDPVTSSHDLYEFSEECVASGSVNSCNTSLTACQTAAASSGCSAVIGQCMREYIECVNNLAITVGSTDPLCPNLLRLRTAIIAVAASEPFTDSALELSCFREVCDSATLVCDSNTTIWFGPTVCVAPTPAPSTTEATTVAPPPPTTTMAPPTTTEVTTVPATPQPTTDTMAPNSTETNMTTMEPNSTTVAPNSTEMPEPTNATDSPNVTTGETNMTTVAATNVTTAEPTNVTTAEPTNVTTAEPTNVTSAEPSTLQPTAAPATPIPTTIEYHFLLQRLDGVALPDLEAAIVAELGVSGGNTSVNLTLVEGGMVRLSFIGSDSNELSNRMLVLQNNTAALTRMGVASFAAVAVEVTDAPSASTPNAGDDSSADAITIGLASACGVLVVGAGIIAVYRVRSGGKRVQTIAATTTKSIPDPFDAVPEPRKDSVLSIPMQDASKRSSISMEQQGGTATPSGLQMQARPTERPQHPVLNHGFDDTL